MEILTQSTNEPSTMVQVLPDYCHRDISETYINELEAPTEDIYSEYLSLSTQPTNESSEGVEVLTDYYHGDYSKMYHIKELGTETEDVFRTSEIFNTIK